MKRNWSLVLLVVAVLLTLFHRNTGQTCPSAGYKYLDTFDKCVKLYNNHAQRQSDAEFTCGVINDGHLLSVHNSFQKRQILDFIAEQDSPVAYQSLWLGLTTNDKNQFTWSDDSTFDYNSWAVGEPSDDGKCTVMLSNGGLTNAGDWYNTSCDELWNFVCQTEAQKCPDEKWTYFDRTNACYRIFKIGGYGEDFCNLYSVDNGPISDGVSIHSREENIFIAKLAAESDVYYDSLVYLHLGLNRKGDRWAWFDETPLDYTAWNADEPSSNSYYAYMMVGQQYPWWHTSRDPPAKIHPVCKIQLS